MSSMQNGSVFFFRHALAVTLSKGNSLISLSFKLHRRSWRRRRLRLLLELVVGNERRAQYSALLFFATLFSGQTVTPPASAVSRFSGGRAEDCNFSSTAPFQIRDYCVYFDHALIFIGYFIYCMYPIVN
jgi:hypothetical protein